MTSPNARTKARASSKWTKYININNKSPLLASCLHLPKVPQPPQIVAPTGDKGFNYLSLKEAAIHVIFIKMHVKVS